MYTAIVTPYVASFHLSEPGYGKSEKTDKTFDRDPITIVDFIGKGQETVVTRLRGGGGDAAMITKN